jgi:adhesin transport system membrane fusion protein
MSDRLSGSLARDWISNHSSSAVAWLTLLALCLFVLWARMFEIDEVARGSGKVIPASREQVVQSLEGGILSSIKVREGQVVQRGQVVAQLDRTRVESGVQETRARLTSSMAAAARLQAEVNGTPLVFPSQVLRDRALVGAETALYNTRRESLNKTLLGIRESLALVSRELQMTESLKAMGAASDVEVLRLRRQEAELKAKAEEAQAQYLVRAREELAKVNAEVDVQQSVQRGRSDALDRLTVASPVRGVVKDIENNTVGGVIPPNGKLMTIVPVDDSLLVDVRISPRDVAFITPGQAATVKVTAYDSAIYGSLKGNVVSISPDTIRDDVKRDEYYYRALVRTDVSSLKGRDGADLPIFPGMVAEVEVHTGSKSIWTYLVKPFNKVGQAMGER